MLLLCSCMNYHRIITKQQLDKKWNSDTLDHIVYIGSNEKYHYFIRNHLFGDEQYAVDKKEHFETIEEFKISEGKRVMYFPNKLK